MRTAVLFEMQYLIFSEIFSLFVFFRHVAAQGSESGSIVEIELSSPEIKERCSCRTQTNPLDGADWREALSGRQDGK